MVTGECEHKVYTAKHNLFLFYYCLSGHTSIRLHKLWWSLSQVQRPQQKLLYGLHTVLIVSTFFFVHQGWNWLRLHAANFRGYGRVKDKGFLLSFQTMVHEMERN